MSKRARRSSTRHRKSTVARAKRNRRDDFFGHAFRSALELLEDRRLLTTVTCDGGAGTTNWDDDANWSLDLVPTSTDDVILDADGIVTLGSDVSVQSLVLDATAVPVTLQTSGFDVDVSGVVTVGVGAQFNIQTGSVVSAGGTMLNEGNVSLSGSTLNVAGGELTNADGGTLELVGENALVADVTNRGTVLSYTNGSYRVSETVLVEGSFTNAEEAVVRLLGGHEATGTLRVTEGFTNAGLEQRIFHNQGRTADPSCLRKFNRFQPTK